MAEAIDPREVLGEYVRVHYNLKRCKQGRDPAPGESCWVVKTKQGGKWLVAGYVDHILLKDVKLHVSRAGVNRIRNVTGQREVIAWFEGTVADPNSSSMKRAIGGGEWLGVGFNPFEGYSFYLYETDEEVDYAPLAYVSGRKAIALFEMPNPGEIADDPEDYLEILVEEVGGDIDTAGDGELEGFEDNPRAVGDPEEQELLMNAVADYWVKKHFYRGRAQVMRVFEEGAFRPFEAGDDTGWDEYMGEYKWLARAVIFPEWGLPRPYNEGAYYDGLDAALEPLGYKHYIVNDAVIVLMVDPYSDVGQEMLEEVYGD